MKISDPVRFGFIAISVFVLLWGASLLDDFSEWRGERKTLKWLKKMKKW